MNVKWAEAEPYLGFNGTPNIDVRVEIRPRKDVNCSSLSNLAKQLCSL
jgi:hypothetical protein